MYCSCFKRTNRSRSKYVIKVKYDTKRIGAFNKSVTITSNAVTNPTQVIRIKGKTLAVDGTSTTPVKPTGSSPIAKPNK